MTNEEIKKKVLQFNDWEFWIDRPFGAFLMSAYGGQNKEYMLRVGVDAEWPAILFQNGAWYKSDKVWDIFEEELKKYKKDKVFEVVKQCEDYAKRSRKKVMEIGKLSLSEKEKLSLIYDILVQGTSFVWLAHGLEHLYNKILHQEVPKYMTGDVEKNIGDISYPKKKNANYYFEEELKSSVSIEKVRQKFGWIKARGGFADGFSGKELATMRKQLKSQTAKKFIRPRIHPKLKELVAIAQELVYFRTLRTDIMYELMWIARPILTKIAKSFGLTFKELRDYRVPDLLKSKVEKYEYEKFTTIAYGKESAFFHKPVFVEKKQADLTELRGAVAFKGIARGFVKVVKAAYEIDKVNQGDILVAPTTAPSYIMGMKKAAAFVTDEGGITSHTAIVAREMKKPCIIGTKIATKVFKDGDFVEVDANNGVVRKTKK